MSKKWLRQVFSIAALFLMTAAPAASADDIVVSAAASLTDALKEIGRMYQSKSKNRVTFVFASSSTLARQIEAGAPADVFFSADVQTMNALERNGRLEPGTRKQLLSNQLVIIVPADKPTVVNSSEDLLDPRVRRIALAEPSSVPAGVYSKTYLESLGLWDKIKLKVVPVLDVRATLASVESGNVEAGFVYKTDAASSKRVKTVFEVPIGKGPKIVYPVAILKESKSKAAAKEFLNVMVGPSGADVFKRYGFVALQ
jgi:molybdate transport system substrate-binding protein